MSTGRTDFDVSKGRLENQCYFQGFTSCVLQNYKLCKNNALCGVAMLYVNTMVCDVAMNSLEVS